MNLNDKNWGCPKKRLAREETVVSFYRQAFKRKSIEQQYWTMCGQCADGGIHPIPGCEYDHVTSSRLVKDWQFNGVEIVPEIHHANNRIKGDAHWYLGDFYETMVAEDNLGRFHPSIINADLLMMPENGAAYLSKILAFLTSINTRRVMVVANVILRQRQHKFSNDDMVKFLSQNAQFNYAIEVGKWKMFPEGYVYNGTGNKRSVMGTIIFVRK